MEQLPTNIKELQEALLKERLKSETRRLNYEKLKVLNARLESSLNEVSGEVEKLKMSENKLLQPLRVETVSGDCATHHQATADLQLNHNDTISINKDHQNNKNPTEAVFWKTTYLDVLNEYEKFKTDTRLQLNDITHIYEEKVNMVVESNEAIKQELEIEKKKTKAEVKELRRENAWLKTELIETRQELDECCKEKIQKMHENKEINSELIALKNSSLKQQDCKDKHHEDLRNKLLLSDRKTSYLESEVDKLQERCDHLLRELSRTNSSKGVEFQELEEQLKICEKTLEDERRIFEEKYLAIQELLESQQTYMANIDQFVKGQEIRNELNKEELSSYAATVVNDANNTLLMIKAKLRKNKTDVTEISKNLQTCLQVVDNLKCESRSCKSVVDQFAEQVVQCMCLSPLPYTLEFVQSIDSEFKSLVVQCDSQLLVCKENNEDGHSETQIESSEFILNHIKDRLQTVFKVFGYWQEHHQDRQTKLIERLQEVERQLVKERKEQMELQANSEQKITELKHMIKTMRSKLIITKQFVKTCNIPQPESTTTLYERFPAENAGGGGDGDGPTKAVLPESLDLSQFQSKHIQFGDIVDHIDKYVKKSSSGAEPEQQDRPKS